MLNKDIVPTSTKKISNLIDALKEEGSPLQSLVPMETEKKKQITYKRKRDNDGDITNNPSQMKMHSSLGDACTSHGELRAKPVDTTALDILSTLCAQESLEIKSYPSNQKTLYDELRSNLLTAQGSIAKADKNVLQPNVNHNEQSFSSIPAHRLSPIPSRHSVRNSSSGMPNVPDIPLSSKSKPIDSANESRTKKTIASANIRNTTNYITTSKTKSTDESTKLLPTNIEKNNFARNDPFSVPQHQQNHMMQTQRAFYSNPIHTNHYFPPHYYPPHSVYPPPEARCQICKKTDCTGIGARNICPMLNTIVKLTPTYTSQTTRWKPTRRCAVCTMYSNDLNCGMGSNNRERCKNFALDGTPKAKSIKREVQKMK